MGGMFPRLRMRLTREERDQAPEFGFCDRPREALSGEQSDVRVYVSLDPNMPSETVCRWSRLVPSLVRK